MNLQEAVIEGKKLIQIGKLNGRDTRRIEKKVKEIEQRQKEKFEARNQPLGVDEVCGISIDEFRKRNIAVEIYSQVLDEKIWFCSNTDMAKQIKGDDPEAVCYTTDELYELRELCLLDPSDEMLKGVNNVKSVFEDSKVVKTCRNIKKCDASENT